jgi:hypothetical protein
MTPSPEARIGEGAVTTTGPRPGPYLRAVPVASMLCVAGAGGHLVAFQQILVHGLAVALPFLLSATAQLVVARQLWTSRRAAPVLSAVLVLGLLIGLYVVAVRVGVTVGPHDQPFQADSVRTGVLIAQLAALALLLRDLNGRARSWAVNSLLVLGLTLWTLRLTGLLG